MSKIFFDSLSRLLCRVGIHDWGMWINIGLVLQKRYCKTCNIAKTRLNWE